MVLWIATANDLSSLKPSLVDRCLVMHVDPPNAGWRAVLLHVLFAQALARTQAQRLPTLDEEILILLEDVSPRRARIVLKLAIAHAVSAQRDHVSPDDVREMWRLARGAAPRRMGF